MTNKSIDRIMLLCAIGKACILIGAMVFFVATDFIVESGIITLAP